MQLELRWGAEFLAEISGLGFIGCVCLFSFLLITDSRARAELARRAGARAGVTWGLLLSLAVEC